MNIEESIKLEKLIYKESLMDKFDKITIYFIFGWVAIIPFIIYFKQRQNNDSKESLYYIFFLLSILGIYIIYRKATEKKLIKIITSNSQENNKLIINQYCSQENFGKYRDSKKIIIYNEDADFNINPNFKTSYIFLLDNNVILFTILKERFKVNLPTTTKHLVVKSDLKKLLKKNNSD